jgi:hypothetical protein
MMVSEIYNKNGIVIKHNSIGQKYILDLGGQSYSFDRLPGSLEELKKDRPGIDYHIEKSNINEKNLSELLKRDWSKEK